MTAKALSLALLLAMAVSGPAAATDVSVMAIDNTGAPVGTISLRGGKTGIVMRVALDPGTLSPGWHGMHLHAAGDCGDIEAFKNAQSHVAHGGEMHGLLNPAGPEAGDLPNLWVAADGSAHAEIASLLVTLTGEPVGLLDADGSALVIHESEDDHMSQPIGNSGGRKVCAVLK